MKYTIHEEPTWVHRYNEFEKYQPHQHHFLFSHKFENPIHATVRVYKCKCGKCLICWNDIQKII